MLALPALASSRRILVPMTDGPFYPARASDAVAKGPKACRLPGACQ